MGLPSLLALRPTRLTLRLCGLSAALTLLLALTGIPRWRGRDLPFLLLAVTPYLALAALAAGLGPKLGRRRRWAWSLFGLGVALCLAGVGCFAVDSWAFHTVAEYGMVQRFTVIVVPLLQLAVIAPVALITLLRGQGP